MNGSVLPAPVRADAAAPAGWYADPIRGTGWRWWNGSAWTRFTDETPGNSLTTSGGSAAKRPRGPRWVSLPVGICLPLVAIAVVVMAATGPITVVAALVPLAIVLPVVSWFDRVEPEPRASRAHALLWGATVAVTGAFVVNTLVAVVAGDTAAMVLSAPIVEEGLKALGIIWAVRRLEVDGMTDGIVYAAWVALGFAVVEDMTYFAQASVEGTFLPVFLLRALLTPFAHPLFTFWTGLAIGLAVRAGASLWPRALWGYALSVATHMLWNGSLSVGDITTDIDEDVAATVILVTAGLFVLLFVAVAVAIVRIRGAERRRFERGVPDVVLRHGIAPDEAMMFATWRGLLAARRALARSRRRDFDAVHGAIARLVALHARPGPVDRDTEVALGAQLTDARARLRRQG